MLLLMEEHEGNMIFVGKAKPEDTVRVGDFILSCNAVIMEAKMVDDMIHAIASPLYAGQVLTDVQTPEVYKHSSADILYSALDKDISNCNYYQYVLYGLGDSLEYDGKKYVVTASRIVEHQVLTVIEYTLRKEETV